MGGADGTVIGAGGGGDRDTGGQPGKGGDREADRIFREHVGRASECCRGTDGGGTAEAGQEACAVGAGESGPSV